ncbi:MAG TPA: PilZ domain-containing protein [Myxococcota bacterium]
MNEPYANKRRHPRVDLALLVQYRFGALEELRTEYALNVSASGMFIATGEAKPIGTRVFVQLTTRDGAHFLQGEGRVVRNADGGYAIELVGFDAEARVVLEKLVEEARVKAGLGAVPRPAS